MSTTVSSTERERGSTGIAAVATRATSPAPAAMSSVVRSPSSEGSTASPTRIVITDSTTAATADAVEVPTERIRVLRPLAAAVRSVGTARMIRSGSEPYASATPAPTSEITRATCQACESSTVPSP